MSFVIEKKIRQKKTELGIKLYAGNHMLREKASVIIMTSRYKKGDLVIIDDDGSPLEVEIVSTISARGFKGQDEQIYDAKEVTNGTTRTISEDQILRLATPVDNSAQLFSKKSAKR